MSHHPRFDDQQREALSALVDGQAGSQEVADACARWASDPEQRAAWARYHLIGDVLRSEEVGRLDRGEAFLSRFRERLAAEPVVLAPGRVTVPVPAAEAVTPAFEPAPLRARRWSGPLSVAAGFVAVVAALLNTGVDVGGQNGVGVAAVGGAPLSLAPGAAWPVAGASLEAAPSFSRPAGPDVPVVHVLRDPRADEHMLVRSADAGAPTFSAGGGAIRQVAYNSP